MGKTTDGLINLAKQINPNPDSRELDMLLATGEQTSAALLSMALHRLKIKSKSLNAFQAQIRTEGKFNQARIKDFNKSKIKNLFTKNDVIVVTGFQGITDEGDLTTLGRGGSDTSAVALAASLKADCEIYSDVAGIYSTDPKLFPLAKKRQFLTLGGLAVEQEFPTRPLLRVGQLVDWNLSAGRNWKEQRDQGQRHQQASARRGRHAKELSTGKREKMGPVNARPSRSRRSRSQEPGDPHM